MSSERDSQKKCVLEFLQKHGSITSREAFSIYGVTRLSAIIYVLRKEGFDIKTDMFVGKNRFGNNCNYGSYRLES